MKMHDYAFCLFFADFISAGLVTGNVVFAAIFIGMYLAYEYARKNNIIT